MKMVGRLSRWCAALMVLAFCGIATCSPRGLDLPRLSLHVSEADAQWSSSFVPTYSLGSTWVVANAATDIACIEGSASGPIRILRISLEGAAVAGGKSFTMGVVKRSTLNSGGTSTAANPIARDASNPASLATVRTYTANPAALGVTVGTLDLAFPFYGAASSPLNQPAIFDFSASGQLPILRGSGDAVCINPLGDNSLSGVQVFMKVVVQQGT